MHQPRPVRTGALTILVFILIQPLATALPMSLLGATSGAVTDAGVVVGPLAGLLFGFVMQAPAAGFTGFVMAVFSHRIRSNASWLWRSALAGAGLAFVILLVPMRAIFADGTLGAGLVFAGIISIFAGLGAVAAAGVSLKLRSRPWRRPVAETFD